MLELARPEARLISLSLATLGLTSGITLLFPYVSGLVVDTLSSAGEDDFLTPVNAAAGLFGLTMISGVAVTARSMMLTVAGNRIVKRMRERLFAAVISQEIAYFDSIKTGDLVTRLSADTQLVQKAATSHIVTSARAIVMSTGATAAMLYTSPQLCAMSLATLPPVFVSARYFGRMLRARQKEVQELLGESTAHAEETINQMNTVRAFAAEAHEASKYNKLVGDVCDKAIDTGKSQAVFDGGVHVAANAAILAVLGWGGQMVIESSLSAGQLASFLMYSMFVAGNISSLSSVWADIQKAGGAASRVFSIIDRSPKMEPVVLDGNAEVAAASEPLSIEFQNVSFAYPSRADVPIIGPEFSLSIKSGEVLALVGGSGSGKSTAANLLSRLYDVDSGSVLVDGVDVKTWDPSVLRKNIGVVAQEPVLFAASIADNIRYGNLSASRHEVEEAARAANVLAFSENFPNGLDTYVGQRGTQLSGGQKQRVAIARAMLKGAPIMIFDEATSALDASNEAEVQSAIERALKGRTVISIAHRLSTIRDADRIALLKDGRIVEVGTFEQLLAKKGEFRQLVSRQLTTNNNNEN